MNLYKDEDLLVLGIGVSEYKTDGVLRFEHFCKVFDLPYRILGDGKIWMGGEMAAGMGGGQKINEVTEALEKLDNKLVIICDTFDLFPVAGKEEIMDKFNSIYTPGSVIFSSEVYCWPAKNLANVYPKVTSKYAAKYKFLNSGCIMGYRDDIYKLIQDGNVKDNDDDQLFFTKKYLEGANIILDHKCELFQAINGAYDDITFHKNRVYNKYTDSYPIFLHGNGPAKIFLNNLENYIDPHGLGVPTNYYNNNIVPILDDSSVPKVFIALYIDSSKTDQCKIFLSSVFSIRYQNRVIYIYDSSYNEEIKQLVETFQCVYTSDTDKYVYDDFKKLDCEYYFLLEQRCIITKKDILNELVPLCNKYHRIISPLLRGKQNESFTNYWGDIGSDGYYKRADDYFTLINSDLRGLWNAPYVSGAILFHGSIINHWNLSKQNSFGDRDMNLCYNLRRDTLFMYMCNYSIYGYME